MSLRKLEMMRYKCLQNIIHRYMYTITYWCITYFLLHSLKVILCNWLGYLYGDKHLEKTVQGKFGDVKIASYLAVLSLLRMALNLYIRYYRLLKYTKLSLVYVYGKIEDLLRKHHWLAGLHLFPKKRHSMIYSDCIY